MRLEVAKENPDATLRVPHPRLAGGGEILREPRLRFRAFSPENKPDNQTTARRP